MKNKKRIVFFNGFYLPHLGGVERYTSNLVSKLKKNYDITIVTCNVPNGKKHEFIDDIEIYRLPVFNILKDRFPFIKKNKIYKEVIKQICNSEIDHIICNTRYYQTTRIGVKIAKKKNIDLSIIDHSSSHISLSNRIIDFFGNIYEDYLTKQILKANPRFYGVSKKCNEWLKYYNIEAAGVFYNSISKQSVKKANDKDKVYISYVGRIIKEKGVENLAKAYMLLKEKYNIDLTIAGDGNYLEYMKNNYPSINYPGSLSHDKVMKLLEKTDIFVHPSMYPEGMPTSILEAGMMKCAIIATDRGGTKEVLDSNQIGIIVKENVEDLCEKLESLLKDKKKMIKLQNNVYKKICDNFTWESTAKKVEEELRKYEK